MTACSAEAPLDQQAAPSSLHVKLTITHGRADERQNDVLRAAHAPLRGDSAPGADPDGPAAPDDHDRGVVVRTNGGEASGGKSPADPSSSPSLKSDNYTLELSVPRLWALEAYGQKTKCVFETHFINFAAGGVLRAADLRNMITSSPAQVGGSYVLHFPVLVRGSGGASNMILSPVAMMRDAPRPANALRKYRDRMRLAYGATIAPSPLPRDRKEGPRELPDREVRKNLNQHFKAHFPVPKELQRLEPTGSPVAAQQVAGYREETVSPEAARQNKKLRVLCVFNKRHTPADAMVYYRAEQKYHDRFAFTYIQDWSLLKMPQQLELVRHTDIYVTGPGTALMNAPFLDDNKAAILIGSWQALEGKKIPFFMEQQLVGGGTDYIFTLFRNFSRTDGADQPIKQDDFDEMLEKAEALIKDPAAVAPGDDGGRRRLAETGGVALPAVSSKESGKAGGDVMLLDKPTSGAKTSLAINPDGSVSPAYTMRHSAEMRLLLELWRNNRDFWDQYMRWVWYEMYDCMLLQWPAVFVYEVAPWRPDRGKCPVPGEIRTKLRELRKKFGLRDWGGTDK